MQKSSWMNSTGTPGLGARADCEAHTRGPQVRQSQPRGARLSPVNRKQPPRFLAGSAKKKQGVSATPCQPNQEKVEDLPQPLASLLRLLRLLCLWLL